MMTSLISFHRRKVPEGKRHCGFSGDHGYDNKITSMQVVMVTSIPDLICSDDEDDDGLIFLLQTIFLGYGPAFKFKTKVPAFENIELYNIMCGEDIMSVGTL